MKLPDGGKVTACRKSTPFQAGDRADAARSGELVPRPAPLVPGNADQLVRIQRLGDDSWALIGIAPGQLWPQLRSFLSAANVQVARMDAREGIIESSYLDLQGRSGLRASASASSGACSAGTANCTFCSSTAAAIRAGRPQSDDLELESEMLRGVAQFIANSADTAPVSMMAEQSISASGKVFIEESSSGSLIVLELPFDRAWASLARALEQSGFEITDRNRSEGRTTSATPATRRTASPAGLAGFRRR
jgi:outer membrane protein assembly factor BamC